MLQVILIQTRKRSFALFVSLLAFVFLGCDAPGAGGFVVLNTNTADQPTTIYYVVDDRSPYGDDEASEDQYGDERECLLLAFDKQQTTDPHGKHHYSAKDISSASWTLCEPYADIERPPLVINSIPPEIAEQLEIELPDLPFQK